MSRRPSVPPPPPLKSNNTSPTPENSTSPIIVIQPISPIDTETSVSSELDPIVIHSVLSPNDSPIRITSSVPVSDQISNEVDDCVPLVVLNEDQVIKEEAALYSTTEQEGIEGKEDDEEEDGDTPLQNKDSPILIENDVVMENDIDWKGYMLKKTSKGIWVNRYFLASSSYLYYWKDIKQYNLKMQPAQRYNISHFKEILKPSPRLLTIIFSNNTKHKIELKLQIENERDDWVTILEAKRKLYSPIELLNELNLKKIEFKTKFFQTILQLSEEEQVNWIFDQLNRPYIDNQLSNTTSKSHNAKYKSAKNHLDLLHASIIVMDDFSAICYDCMEECSNTREPKILAHTKKFMSKYSEGLKNRLILELMSLPGIDKKNLEDLGEGSLCCALELAQRIEFLTEFKSIIPNDFVKTLTSTLFSSGLVISQLLNLVIRRVDSFFSELNTKSIKSRAKSIAEAHNLIFEIIKLLFIEIKDINLLTMLFHKVTTILILNFIDHINQYSFDQYEELNLINHMLACDKSYNYFGCLYFLPSKKVFGNLRNIDERNNENCYPKDAVFISETLLDALKSCFDTSTRNAFLYNISLLQEGKNHLLDNLFRENTEGWIGDILCNALLNHYSQWSNYIVTVLPSKFSTFVHAEVGRLILILYFRKLIEFVKSSKKAIFSSNGLKQLISDLTSIQNWIQNHCENGLSNSILRVEISLIESMIHSILVDTTPDSLLLCYSQLIVLYGLDYGMHLYDFFRLLLKVRIDISNSSRYLILSGIADFYSQLQKSVSRNYHILQGTLRNSYVSSDGNPSISNIPFFDSLLPNVGIEHCTGSKWKVEKAASDQSIRLKVALLVTDTCNHAMAEKCKAFSDSNSNSNENNKEDDSFDSTVINFIESTSSTSSTSTSTSTSSTFSSSISSSSSSSSVQVVETTTINSNVSEISETNTIVNINGKIIPASRVFRPGQEISTNYKSIVIPPPPPKKVSQLPLPDASQNSSVNQPFSPPSKSVPPSSPSNPSNNPTKQPPPTPPTTPPPPPSTSSPSSPPSAPPSGSPRLERPPVPPPPPRPQLQKNNSSSEFQVKPPKPVRRASTSVVIQESQTSPPVQRSPSPSPSSSPQQEALRILLTKAQQNIKY